jgi:hypothetical protein
MAADSRYADNGGAHSLAVGRLAVATAVAACSSFRRWTNILVLFCDFENSAFCSLVVFVLFCNSAYLNCCFLLFSSSDLCLCPEREIITRFGTFKWRLKREHRFKIHR